MKRLRKHFYGNQKSDIRYFHCGEYGEKFQRPHHHAILFNLTFSDITPWQTESGNQLYRSKTLEKLWKHGNSTIGAVNYNTAAYVARYALKKITGKMAPDHYMGRLPEYITMSRRPGIAREWYEKYKNTDVFPRDYIVLNGVKSKIPKYYNKCYELTDPDKYGTIRESRIQKAKIKNEQQPVDLIAHEKIQMSFDKTLIRKYEIQPGDKPCIKSSLSSIKKPAPICTPSTSTIKPKRYVLSKTICVMKSPLSPGTPPTTLYTASANGTKLREFLLHTKPPSLSKKLSTS